MTLVSFLSDISTDPERLASYFDDPEKAMEAADLTADERAAMRSGDRRVIASTLITDAADEPEGHVTEPNEPDGHVTEPDEPDGHVTAPDEEPGHVTSAYSSP